MHDIVRQYIDHPEMTKEEYILLLQQEEDPEAREAIRREALRLCRKYYENRVYIRGLIEFTNYCRLNRCSVKTLTTQERKNAIPAAIAPPPP